MQTEEEKDTTAAASALGPTPDAPPAPDGEPSAEAAREVLKKIANRGRRRALALAIIRNKRRRKPARLRCGNCGRFFIAPAAERCLCPVAKPKRKENN
jgi:hypothetical protein